MTANITIKRAKSDDAQEIAVMMGELLNEIMNDIGTHAFNFNLEETVIRLKHFISRDKYFVFTARDEKKNILGFLAMYESFALYAEGPFGTIPELYVRPQYRSNNVGLHLVKQAKTFAASRGWKRLEVTTPPLPQFDQNFAFYEREGFTIAGGRKFKIDL